MSEGASENDFPDTPQGWARRWTLEFESAKKKHEPWHKRGKDIDAAFRDERDDNTSKDSRWNLFTSGVQTIRAMVFGETPSTDVSRTFADPNDDDARVAGEMLDRVINNEVEVDEDPMSEALGLALDDRLLPGGGFVRVRYEAGMKKVPAKQAMLDPETGAELAPAVPEQDVKDYEECETDYVHWEDVLWSPSRVWGEIRWIAFKNEMSKKRLVERFGDEGKLVPLNTKGKMTKNGERESPWSSADVWEIWDGETKRVFWFVEGHSRTLDDKPDPLGLNGFYPMPRPMLANLTTSSTIPVPDYALAQDLYREINEVTSKIRELMEGVRVAGAYPAESDELKGLLTGKGNKLLPVSNWMKFAEKGGIEGQISWVPIDKVVAAIAVLRDYRRELIEAEFQLTGRSDIMRGQAAGAGATATEQRIKASFGSVRIQALQKEFARFATDVQRLRAEIILKHFDDATILERSNIMQTPDAPRAQSALALLRSGQVRCRIQVKPEAVSLTDFAQVRSERTELVGSLASFLQVAVPAAQQIPGSMPFLLQIGQWLFAGQPGSSTIEGVFDQAIDAAQQAAQQPQQAAQPDPKVVTQQMKGQQDLAKIQAELQADLTRTQAEVQADAQRERTQAIENTREAAAKAQIAQAARMATQGIGGGLP